MAGDKDKKKKRSSKKGSKDRAKSRAKPLDAEAFDRAATTLNDATAKLMRAAERHALGDVNHDGIPDVVSGNIGKDQVYLNFGNGTFLPGQGILYDTPG